MHKLRPLAEYKRKDGWRYEKAAEHTIDTFRARMAGYKAAAKAHQVLPIRRAAK